nr:hypothetical protein [Tanacetum cinerariifolium]
MAAWNRSNSDHIRKISKSIFVSNFPDNTTSKDLWELAFIRFIKVDNVDHLVSNLSTLWIGRMHLQANVAHYERASINSSRPTQPMRTGNHVAKPFVSVLKGNTSPEPSHPTPVMVLDESCVVHRDLANCVMGEVKQFSSIVNLRVLLSNEGFHNVNLTYLGGLWVMCELGFPITKEKFLKHVGVASWFTRLCNAQNDFVSKERVVWVDIEGVPLHAWSRAIFSKIGSKWGEGDAAKVGSKKSNCHVLNVDEESDVKGVSDTVFNEHEENKGNVQENSVNGKEQSSDPFNLYGLLNKRNMEEKLTDPNTSLSHPPGFTLDIERPEVDIHVTDSKGLTSSPRKSNGVDSRIMEETKPADIHTNSTGSKPNYSSQKGGYILEVLDDMIKVGQTMGFSMQVSLQDMENIIGSQGDREGGILCIWDPNLFHKDQRVISDNFVAIYETWLPTYTKILIISVYAPKSYSDKRILWSYLTDLISRWNCESLVLGDFNEVCYKRDWMGSVFNVQGAQDFNSFISITGLVDIQLEGYAFTWSHPLAAKMSKLDWFLVTDGFLSTFPHISALCLDKNLSDHRPILLRELFTDYGATPFKKKLQLLKKEVRSWVHSYKIKHSGQGHYYHNKLWDIDKVLDQRGVTDEILLVRLELTKQIHDIKVQASSDQMQKEKIQWAIKGDKNSKYFHGIVNRKCVNLSVKGIMVDGEWVDEPSRVKEEFRSHFASRFQDLGMCHSHLNFRFPFWLTPHQIIELERPVSIDKIRKAIWSCGENKSPWGCNASFISLIPKTSDPKFINDFRPISLIGSLYKVVSKILAMRLSGAISDLIFDVQTVFLPNRQILDGPFIINELLSGVGLEDYLQKSQLLGVGVTNDSVIAAVGFIGCSIIKTPFKYLRVMVGGNMTKINAWDDTVNKIKTRLSKWKLGTRSIGGRLTLIKSVLGSTSIYSMSLYKVPKTVLHTMEAIRQDFLMGLKVKIGRYHGLNGLKCSRLKNMEV